ncbi:Energy-coupling factor transporter ATP-binding protein [Trichinella spiralis]|uniref:Energy-coupling factor transporter ATP-binding protein n=1 Tax=Trichinella spiralis TaxID=6334 RepID=A0ABR3KML5_TRISP
MIQWQGDLLTTSINSPAIRRKAIAFKPRESKSCQIPRNFRELQLFANTVELDGAEPYQARREFERYLSHAGMTCCAPFRGGSCFFRNTLGIQELSDPTELSGMQSFASTVELDGAEPYQARREFERNTLGLGDLLTTSINTPAIRRNEIAFRNPRAVRSYGTLGNWSRLPTVCIQRELSLTRRGRNCSCHSRMTLPTCCEKVWYGGEESRDFDTDEDSMSIPQSSGRIWASTLRLRHKVQDCRIVNCPVVFDRSAWSYEMLDDMSIYLLKHIMIYASNIFQERLEEI